MDDKELYQMSKEELDQAFNPVGAEEIRLLRNSVALADWLDGFLNRMQNAGQDIEEQRKELRQHRQEAQGMLSVFDDGSVE